MKTLNRSVLALAAAVLCTASLARAADPYTVQAPIHIGGAGRWDYASVDAAAHRLYVTRSTHTQGIDLATGKVVVDVVGQKRSHGVAAVDSVGRGYLTDGGAGVIVIFDLKTGQVLGDAAAADDADGEIYDAGSNKILATCGDAGVMAVLDVNAKPADARAQTVDLGGNPSSLPPTAKGWPMPTSPIRTRSRWSISRP